VQAHYSAGTGGGGGTTPPSSSTPPSISGSAFVGSTLTVNAGTWSGTQPITLTHQWRRCDTSGASCTDIAGATGTSYQLVAGDAGSTVRVRETATNTAGSAFADSQPTAVVTQPSPSAYKDAVTADNPFLYWRLGEASGTFANSAGIAGNTGTANGSGLSRHVSDLVSANSDGALSFTDGTSYVGTTSTLQGASASAISAEAWFKASSFANAIDLVNHSYGGTGGQGLAMYVASTGVLSFGLWQSGGSAQVVSSSALSLNTTYHVVGTYDGSVMRLYVNGTLVASKTVGALTLNTTSSVFTGRTDTAGPVTVDELALYPSALSATRVQAHYSAGTS
jgi:hypothetical protein